MEAKIVLVGFFCLFNLDPEAFTPEQLILKR